MKFDKTRMFQIAGIPEPKILKEAATHSVRAFITAAAAMGFIPKNPNDAKFHEEIHDIIDDEYGNCGFKGSIEDLVHSQNDSIGLEDLGFRMMMTNEQPAKEPVKVTSGLETEDFEEWKRMARKRYPNCIIKDRSDSIGAYLNGVEVGYWSNDGGVGEVRKTPTSKYINTEEPE